jgi:hypothetical protein
VSSPPAAIVTDMSEPIGQGLHYYVLPDDPAKPLNILREAAGLEPWPDTDDRSVPDSQRHQ